MLGRVCPRWSNLYRYFLSVLTLPLASSALIFAASSLPTAQSDTLQSFYIVSHVVSDAAPFWYDYVLDISPKDKDVRVRFLRVAPLNFACERSITVKAVERVVRNSGVQSLASTPLCSLEESSVASAIEVVSPNRMTSIDDAVRFTIVAQCEKETRVFDLPFGESIDFERLRKVNRSVARLWGLSAAIERHSFGKSFSFYGASASEDAAFQELGSELVPSLRSGIYDRAFSRSDSLSVLMTDYIGPTAKERPEYVELLDGSSLHLTKYVPPIYPPLASQARIQGKVELAIDVNAQTGEVRGLEVVSGHPLFVEPALSAARQWRFDPAHHLQGAIQATLRFELTCPPAIPPAISNP